MYVSLWITLKENFSKANKFSSGIGLDIQMILFFIQIASGKELDEFLNHLNSFHPNLRFTHECSRESLNFLDVIIKIEQGEFVTDLYCKSIDGHQHVLFDTCHGSHTRTSIACSQALRKKRICSRRSDLVININKLKD